MLKEYCAAFILALTFSAVLFNIGHLNSVLKDMDEKTERAYELARENRWEEAEEQAAEIEKIWDRNSAYVHISLHHGETDDTAMAIYAYMEDLISKDLNSVSGSYKVLSYRIESIREDESISLKSIF